MENQVISACVTNKVLELTILPTTQCNFRCKYCYIDFKDDQMGNKEVETIKKLISNRTSYPGFLHLNIKWFGGEPLLCKGTIVAINSFCKELSISRGFRFTSGITTNGSLLTSKTLETLVNNNVTDYQVTLDGDEDSHNNLRPYKNKSGSFDKVLGALDTIYESNHKLGCTLRLNIAEENFDAAKRVIKNELKKYQKDSRFDIYPVKVGDFSGDLKMDLVKEENSIFRKVEENYVCYASKLNNFVIFPDLSLGKCTVSLYWNKNKVGKILNTGEIRMENEKIQYWSRGLISKDKQVLQCPARSPIYGS
ncbi:radical SAM protein [Vibrio sp. 10N.222.49.A3]|uniref:radical SAM protein n=1 Tax=Vibrio sp. 10N.222.49.A3 TaxID=3229611 RepID=UPI003550330B